MRSSFSTSAAFKTFPMETTVSFTAMAEEAATEGRQIIARKFLKQAMSQTSPYITAELRQRCRRLSTEGQEPTEEPEEVPPLDGELFYRSRLALAAGDGARAGALLDAWVAPDFAGKEHDSD